MLIDLINGEIEEQDYLSYYDVKVLTLKLPKRVYGFVFKYKSFNYIGVNKFISENKKKYVLLHELAHIELSHLDKRRTLMEFNIEGLEDEADRYIEFINNNLEER